MRKLYENFHIYTFKKEQFPRKLYVKIRQLKIVLGLGHLKFFLSTGIHQYDEILTFYTSFNQSEDSRPVECDVTVSPVYARTPPVQWKNLKWPGLCASTYFFLVNMCFFCSRRPSYRCTTYSKALRICPSKLLGI